MDTIVALSSGRPPAAIGVIRISGPRAIEAANALTRTLPLPRRAAVRSLRDRDGKLLDRALVLVFPGPGTATGEDLVELHCHGGRAVVDAVQAAVVSQPGCRLAEPGEFTRRALSNGRIDLAEAEGLADLLEAETESQRIAALAATEGRISRQVGAWMAELASLSAQVEVVIDYDDEDDGASDDGAIIRIAEEAEQLGATIRTAADTPPVERLREGVRVVIAGPPNAGKSTLLNLLAEREAAIVSSVAGTTRDLIEAPVSRCGMAFVLTDTAGLTETADPIEAMGVSRARDVIRSAEIMLWLGDDEPPMGAAVRVHARADLPGRSVKPLSAAIAVRRDDPAAIAALWALVAQKAAALVPMADALPWRVRHLALCRTAAQELLAPSREPLLLAEQLRRSRVALAQIVGADATESMLDAMFSRFCLGK